MALLDVLRARLALLIMTVRFRGRMLKIAWGARPVMGAQDGEGEAAADGAAATGAADADASGDSAETDSSDKGHEDSRWDDAPDEDAEIAEWKDYARKWERRAKQERPDRKTASELRRARKELTATQQKLQEREAADKTEQEKAIEEALSRGRTEAESKFETERKQDRLELAVTKIASKGVKVGDGDDAKTVKFADADDALLHLERQITRGDLDAEDIFDSNGRVIEAALTEALTDLLASKPHLASEPGPRKVTGSADAGKGEPASTESSVEDHFNKIRRNKPGAQSAPSILVGRRAG